MTVLYVNHGISERCGVHSFGVRHYNAIKNSHFDIQYVECDSLDQYIAALYKHSPKAVFLNYMPAVMPWVTPTIKMVNHKTIGVLHLYDQGSISKVVDGYSSLFDYAVVLDPSISNADPRIYPMDRPIPEVELEPHTPSSPYRIGTFGFALPHKHIPMIAREINRCFDEAIFNLHMPEAYFNGANGNDVWTTTILNQCKKEITKPGIAINHVGDFLSEEEVVLAASQNDINALFYELPPGNVGRSSALDFLIAARRPLLVSHCDSFQHAFGGVSFHPETSFKDIIDNYPLYEAKAMALASEFKSKLAEQTDQMLESIL